MAFDQASADNGEGAEIKTKLSVPQISTALSEEEKEEDSGIEGRVKWFGRLRSYDSLLRPVSQTRAMSLWRRLTHGFCCVGRRERDDTPSYQYRIPPPSEKRGNLAFLSIVWEGMFMALMRFFSRVNFVDLVLLFILFYFIFIFVFGLVIHGIVLLYDKGGTSCIASYDYERYDFAANSIRSFDLSWTTFSTVGYGTVSTTADSSCLGLRYLLSLEAFNGILFSGVCGGVFFTKIARLHFRAYATFSSCMCLQFGPGVSDAYHLRVETSHKRAPSVVQLFSQRNVMQHLEEEKIKSETEASGTPFPVLVFRLINNRAGIGGEIADASIKCMVVCRADSDDNHDDASNRVSIAGEEINNGVDSSSTSTVVKKTVYCRLKVNPEVNSFFSNGVWCVRHVLNDKSPLVKPCIRKKMAETGSWPSDLDTYSKIRDSLADDIKEIVVTFNGTSNLTADNVFKTVSYKQEDIFVGWQFARMLYLNDGAKTSSGLDIQVDTDLLNDIVPQEGGGEEPLGNDGTIVES